jgi:hypothetical protein
MITPPLSISARPLFTRIVPISIIGRDSSFRPPRSSVAGRSAVSDAEKKRASRVVG